MIPNDLDEAIDVLIKGFIKTSDDNIDTILNEDSTKFVIEEHFNVGLYIRNNWKLWEKETPIVKWFNKLGIYHADDISSLILKAFHAKIKNDTKFDLNKEIKHYIKYWNKVDPNINKGIFN
jgi:hypothetical protein